MTSPSPGDILADAERALDLHLDGEQHARLVEYVNLLARWNRTYNLTAVREPAAMMRQHVVDCLAVVSPLRARVLVDQGQQRLLDVGSGAGLPGLVLAVALPALHVTCVDSVGKKAAFIAQAAAALGLGNLESLHARVEALEGRTYDVVASRAFSSLDTFIDGTEALLEPEGWWMAMKGVPPTAELDAIRGRHRFHVEQLVVPGLDAQRCIAWVQRLPESERTLRLVAEQ